MKFFDNLLSRAHAWAQRVDRRLGEPVLKKPEPRPKPVASIEATTDSGLCTACEKWCACGWLIDGKLFCNLDARPYVRARYDRERSEAPTLAGDPR
jgi:hypothetical protein